LQYFSGNRMNEIQTVEPTAQSVCAQCGSHLESTVGGDQFCINCLLRSALDQDDYDPGETSRPSDQLIPAKDGAPIEFGDYELLEELGRGGQGVVYRARQKSLNRTVALKVIAYGQWASQAHLKRFRREAEAAASLNHPCIVPIHEVGERDGCCYFSMRFVEGGQLDEVVRGTPLSIRQSTELIAKVAQTVHYAHEHGILHRDIKPGNILLDAKGEPHLTDFGLARLVETESTVTRTREVMGTPSYMAPEQAAGETTKVSKATDVYGLGAVLYQLLTSHPPFAGGTSYETIRLLLDTEPRQPRLLNPKVDRELSTICLKCLEKDPQRRYSCALDLAEDLEHWLNHEPIHAKRSGFFTRGRKWVRRNPSTTVLVTLLVALAIFPAAYFTLLRSPSEKAPIEKPGTTDLTAYNLYQRAQVLFEDTSGPIKRREKLPQAARVLDEAVTRDPRFLLAWCLLSRVHSDVYWYGIDPTPARLDLANAAAQTALRLQPDAGEAHLALADYYYHGFEDYDRARAELAIARRKLPNNATVFEDMGYIDRRQGHWEEATRNLERAGELLDPHKPHYFIFLQELAGTYGSQRRYADEVRTLDRALTIVPGHPPTRIRRARIAVEWLADTKPLQTTLAAVVKEDPSIAPDLDDPDYALCERTAAAAARALTNYPRDGVTYAGGGGIATPHAYWEGVVARWQGDPAKAKAAFAAAREEVVKAMEKQPDLPPDVLSLLGTIDAGLGRKEEALQEGRRACQLIPISKDAYRGAGFAGNLVEIYTWTGEKDLAIEQIAALQHVPNALSYGGLKLSPFFDPLRGDPRLEKIVASLAPKESPSKILRNFFADLK
jgi:serine/threonine protein kinase/Flp pilus assembly protein TadD